MNIQTLGTARGGILSLALTATVMLATSQPSQAQPARRAKDINTTLSSASSTPFAGAQIGNITYFNADDGINGPEIWRTERTEAGTQLVKDINPGSAASNPGSMAQPEGDIDIRGNGQHARPGNLEERRHRRRHGTAVRSSAALRRQPFLHHRATSCSLKADDGAHGSELWRTDGTEAGTVLVKDIIPGLESGLDPDLAPGLTDINGTLFFKCKRRHDGRGALEERRL